MRPGGRLGAERTCGAMGVSATAAVTGRRRPVWELTLLAKVEGAWRAGARVMATEVAPARVEVIARFLGGLLMQDGCEGWSSLAETLAERFFFRGLRKSSSSSELSPRAPCFDDLLARA